jgi:hypothetical protein
MRLDREQAIVTSTDGLKDGRTDGFLSGFQGRVDALSVCGYRTMASCRHGCALLRLAKQSQLGDRLAGALSNVNQPCLPPWFFALLGVGADVVGWQFCASGATARVKRDSLCSLEFGQ